MWQLSFGLQATLHSGVRSSLLSKNLSKDGASYDGMVSLGIQAQKIADLTILSAAVGSS